MAIVSGGSTSNSYDRPQAQQNDQDKLRSGKTHRHHHYNSQQDPPQTTTTNASAASTITIESIIKNYLHGREG